MTMPLTTADAIGPREGQPGLDPGLALAPLSRPRRAEDGAVTAAAPTLDGRHITAVVFEIGFAPAVVVFTVAGALLSRQAGLSWANALFASMALPLVVITAVETVHPYRRDWNLPFRAKPREALQELAVDLLFAVLITRIHSWLMAPIAAATTKPMRALGRSLGVYGALSGLPTWTRVALLLLLGELIWYAGHRLFHTVPLLWRFHRAHHEPTRLSALKAARNHPVDMLLLSVVGYLPLVALGAKPRDLMVAALIQSIVNVLSHANVPIRGRALAWLFATADYHRVHHSTNVAESQSNYGCRFLVWDWVFGTLRAPRDGVEVGVEPGRPLSLAAQLFGPFVPRLR